MELGYPVLYIACMAQCNQCNRDKKAVQYFSGQIVFKAKLIIYHESFQNIIIGIQDYIASMMLGYLATTKPSSILSNFGQPSNVLGSRSTNAVPFEHVAKLPFIKSVPLSKFKKLGLSRMIQAK